MAILHEHIEGKYEILGKLREGGMGAVYKVRHRLLDEIRVVKVLHPRLTVTPELSERFLREARLAIQLRHPNIAQLHDFSVAEDGSAFIIMEFIDGVTLEGIRIRTGPPPVGLGLEIGRQSLRALGLLHRRGLLHRDISPDNLMLTRDAEGSPLVKLIDLGIAKVLKGDGSGLTSEGLFLGKPRYASPEQFGLEGSLGVDARSDLYSFAIVLYELLTGVCPIRGRDASSYMASHLFREPVDFAESDPYDKLPLDLREILLRALARNPEDRFASAEDLGGALAEVQIRFPFTPAHLNAALRAEDEPVEPPKPGSTQDKLNRQFAGPTPVATVRSTPVREPTVVLPGAAFSSLDDTAVAPGLREPPPPATPEPAPVVPPPEEPPPERPKKRGAFPVVVVAVLVLPILGGLGFWWRSQPDAAARPAPVPVQLAASAPSPVVETPFQRATETPAPPPPIPLKPAETVPVAAVPVATPTPRAAPPKASPPPPTKRAPAPQTPPAPKPTTQFQEAAVPPVEIREANVPAPHQPAPLPLPEPPKPEPTQQQAERAPAPVADTLPPRLLSEATPVFPDVARKTPCYARIVVRMLIAETGEISEARIKEASLEDGKPTDAGKSRRLAPLLHAFAEAALEAARKSRFRPATRTNGAPVKAWVDLKFEFGKKPNSYAL